MFTGEMRTSVMSRDPLNVWTLETLLWL